MPIEINPVMHQRGLSLFLADGSFLKVVRYFIDSCHDHHHLFWPMVLCSKYLQLTSISTGRSTIHCPMNTFISSFISKTCSYPTSQNICSIQQQLLFNYCLLSLSLYGGQGLDYGLGRKNSTTYSPPLPPACYRRWQKEGWWTSVAKLIIA